jgi:two-component system cell cycle sensor histidine kinase/response regulator CckA
MAAFRPKQILVVDDEEIIRRFVFRLLNSEGYRVFEASDLDEAMQVLQTTRQLLDLVILDVRMPVNGVEFARRIHQHWPEQRVMFMSAYPAQLLAQLGADAELFYAFLAKPFTRDELLAKVGEALERPAPRHAQPEHRQFPRRSGEHRSG